MTDLAGAPAEARVRLRSIALQRLDGPRATATVPTVPEADDILRVWAQSAPEPGQGYHRVAYLLVFEDGQEYREIYHLYRGDVGPVDLARTVCGHLEAAAGRRYPELEPTAGSRRRLVLSPDRDRQSARKRAAALLDGYALD